MKFIDIFILATRMFKARTMRTFLTILGMSIGIGAIIFLVSLGYGLQKTLLEKITTSDSLLTLDVASKGEEGAVLDATALEKIKELPSVSEISPVASISAQASFDNLTAEIPALAVTASYFRLSGIKIEEGSYPDDAKNEEVVISSSVAKIFSQNTGELVGKEISLAFFIPRANTNPEVGNKSIQRKQSDFEKFQPDGKFRVAGIINQEDNLIYVNLKNFRDQNIGYFSGLKVKCRSDKDMAGARDQIMEQGFMVSSISETVDQVNKVFRVVKIILMLFGIIALIVSAIGMFNTMTIALLERTEEIGIMKSIGASDRAISLMFIMEATIMGFLGGILGIAIGWLEGTIFNALINLIAVFFGGQKIDLFYSPAWFIFTVVIFAAVVGFLTGVVPARRASRIDPLDALRYK